MQKLETSINNIESTKLKISKLKNKLRSDNVRIMFIMKLIIMFLECSKVF